MGLVYVYKGLTLLLSGFKAYVERPQIPVVEAMR